MIRRVSRRSRDSEHPRRTLTCAVHPGTWTRKPISCGTQVEPWRMRPGAACVPKGFQEVGDSLPGSAATWAFRDRAHHVTQDHPAYIPRAARCPVRWMAAEHLFRRSGHIVQHRLGCSCAGPIFHHCRHQPTVVWRLGSRRRGLCTLSATPASPTWSARRRRRRTPAGSAASLPIRRRKWRAADAMGRTAPMPAAAAAETPALAEVVAASRRVAAAAPQGRRLTTRAAPANRMRRRKPSTTRTAT